MRLIVFSVIYRGTRYKTFCSFPKLLILIFYYNTVVLTRLLSLNNHGYLNENKSGLHFSEVLNMKQACKFFDKQEEQRSRMLYVCSSSYIFSVLWIKKLYHLELDGWTNYVLAIRSCVYRKYSEQLSGRFLCTVFLVMLDQLPSVCSL